MSHYPYLSSKDKKLAQDAIGHLRILANKASNPKLKASAAQWTGILHACLKTPWPGAAK
jgi:hypothetical protein